MTATNSYVVFGLMWIGKPRLASCAINISRTMNLLEIAERETEIAAALCRSGVTERRPVQKLDRGPRTPEIAERGMDTAAARCRGSVRARPRTGFRAAQITKLRAVSRSARTAPSDDRT